MWYFILHNEEKMNMNLNITIKENRTHTEAQSIISVSVCLIPDCQQKKLSRTESKKWRKDARGANPKKDIFNTRKLWLTPKYSYKNCHDLNGTFETQTHYYSHYYFLLWDYN